VAEVAAARGVGPAQIAVAWLLGQTGVNSPIVGASKLHHLDDAVKALETQLGPEESARLEGAYETMAPLPLYIRPVPTVTASTPR
jgi:aryl-alcohol dehydrogenase-like predicted oxidoreductase